MKREIKFRGKYIDDSWTYGNLEDGGITQLIAEYFIDRDTIGQYIGRKDKNGKEVYEGDIIKWYNDVYKRYIIAEIAWDDDDLGFSAKDAYGFFTFIPKYTNIEIIGNIYDNPELLKDYEKE